jgi:replicative DNA helicase
MPQVQVQLLNAICKDKDVHVILGEDSEIFGSYAPEFDMLRDYYDRFRTAPSLDVVREQFPDVEEVPANAPSVYYVEILRAKYLTTQLDQLIRNAAGAIDNDRPATAILEKMQTEISKLGKFTGGPQDLDLNDVDYIVEHLESLREISAMNDGVPGIPTGFKSIDSAYTTGMAPGHLITLIGFTGKMKSMFAAMLALRALDAGKKVMYVNCEMNPEEQLERLIALKAAGLFSMTDWSRGDINIDEFRTWARDNLVNSPMFKMIRTRGVQQVTPNWIQSKIDKYKPDIVFADYAQLMFDNAKSGPMTTRMTNLSHETKNMATSNEIPVVLISAVTDGEGEKREGPPMLSQISWASAIEYDSNLCIAVHLHEDSRQIEIACRKNRRGPSFAFYLNATDVDRGIITENFDIPSV